MLFKKQRKKEQLDLTQVQIGLFSNSVIYNHFDCGAKPLNRFLKNKALNQMRRYESRVFAATLNGSPNCIGYYALQLGSDNMPDSLKDRRQDYSKNYKAFPAIDLNYLAVDSRYQGMGLGTYLLQDVFEKVASVAECAGFYALTLQSYDQNSTKFYKKLGFEEFSEGPGQPKMLYPTQNIMRLIRGE